MSDLVAAATKEGNLTTIALPYDWCAYGAVIDGFKKKYPGIAVCPIRRQATPLKTRVQSRERTEAL